MLNEINKEIDINQAIEEARLSLKKNQEIIIINSKKK